MAKNLKPFKKVSENPDLHYKHLVEDSPFAKYICDRDGMITYYNKAASILWGRSPTIGKQYWCGSWKMYFPDGSPMHLDQTPMAKIIKDGQSKKNTELTIERPDHTFRNLIVFPKPIFDREGKLIGGHNTLVDISEQHNEYIKQATLSAIVESSDDAIIGKDLNGIINSWNSGAERIFGYSEKEVLGKSIMLLIPEDRLHEEQEIISNIRKGKRIHHIDTIRLDKWGKNIPISLTISPIKGASGNIVGASKVARDISERLYNEEKQAILSSIVESSDDGIISENLNGIITSWNQGAKGIFGYSEDDMIGESIRILSPPERMEEDNMILKFISSGKKVDRFETIRKQKSGKEIAVSITASPLKDSHGNILGVSKIIRDITLQVESQVAMEDYIKNLEALNDIGKNISENLDMQSILQRVSDASTNLTGAAYGVFFYNTQDEKGKNLELFSLSGAKTGAFKLAEMLRHTDIFNTTFATNTVLRIDDIRKHVDFGINSLYKKLPETYSLMTSYLAVPVVDKSESVVGGLLFGSPQPGIFTAEHELLILNIAAQAVVSLDNSRLFEQVKSLSDKKDEFIALASHELKTPLTTIKGYLQILSKWHNNKTSELFLHKSLSQVNRLNKLVEDLLNMSRIEADRLNFTMEVFDLKKMLQEIIDTFLYSAQSHKIIENLGNTPAIIEGDKQRIEQAILNLLTNAVKYSPKAETVYVYLDVTEANVTVRIKDEGMGLTQAQKKQLFTRFYRAETNSSISGLGLGLYLTKQIIDRHAGTIEVLSKYGEGSEFNFTLPLKIEKEKSGNKKF